MTGDLSRKDEARITKALFRTWPRKIRDSTLVNQIIGSVVTTLVLSAGFMFFNDYIAPPPDLSGRWKFTVTYDNTDLPRYEGLQVTYQVLLIQDGLELSGSGEKLSDRGAGQPLRDYKGEDRGHIQIVGGIKRNYFSRDAVVLHYREEGQSRESSTLHQLVEYGRESMSGRFSTTIANTSGPVLWQRRASIFESDRIYEPAERTEMSTE